MEKLLELFAIVNEYTAGQEDLRTEIQYISQTGNIEIKFDTILHDSEGNEIYETNMNFIQFDPSDNTIFLWNSFRQEYRTIDGMITLKMVLNIMF